MFSGFAGTELLMEGHRVVGVRTGDRGIGRHGEKRDTFEPGVDIHAKVTILADGVRGNLTKQLMRRSRITVGQSAAVVRARHQGTVGRARRPACLAAP